MAQTINYATASMDDIVFEGRNKKYGAYLLRKIYNKNVTISTIIAIALFILLLSAPLIANLLGGDEEEVVIKEEKIVELAEPPSLENKPPPPPPPNLPPPPPPVVSTVKFTPPVIKKDEEVRKEEEIPDQKELEDVVISTKTVEGNTSTEQVLTEVATPTEVGEVVEDKIFTFVEQQPSFPGGEGELQKFLKKNIKYPPAALRNGLEGLVVVQFVVNKEGEISDVQVVKKLGGGTDEEAMRVAKLLPKFTPARQNGRPVSFRYTLPVRFGLQ